MTLRDDAVTLRSRFKTCQEAFSPLQQELISSQVEGRCGYDRFFKIIIGPGHAGLQKGGKKEDYLKIQ